MNAFKMGLSLSQIAQISGLNEDEVKEIADRS